MADEAYIPLDIFDADYDQIVADALDSLADSMDGWTPREGHLEVQLIEVVAREVAEATAAAIRVPPAIFRYFGQSLLGIAPIDAAYARVQSTWTLRDSLGHTIPAGTVVAYQVAADRQTYFAVETDVIVSPGNNATATGEVTLVAVEPGTAPNGLEAGEVAVVDALAWVQTIETEATVSGGVDAETDDEYLDRLRSELRLLTPRPILPNDFAVLARRIAGVARAFAIDGYNPTLGTSDNERVVTVAVVDELGNALSSGVKDQVEEYLDGLREVNFTVFVIDPTFTSVNVTASVAILDGADPAAVEEACEQALVDYLDPAAWEWSKTVRRNELIALLDRVEGVDYVVNISTPAADVALGGAASLATAGAISVSAS